MENLALEEKQLIEDNIKRIKDEIKETAIKAGRKEGDISLLAVTKTVEVERINHAIDCGINLLGENRVQEFLAKRDKIRLDKAGLHFIGRLQTNKVKNIVGQVDLIQSIDSLRLAKAVDKQAKKLGICQKVLLQVNIGREETKGGFDVEELVDVVYELSTLEGISIKGLMAIPPFCEKGEEVCKYFYDMHKLFVDIDSKKIDNVSMYALSMGMSSDYKEAIKMGSSIIRLGSSIFGKRA